MSRRKKTFQFEQTLEYFYAESKDQNTDSVLLLLHGYQQNAQWIYRKLEKEVDFAGQILAFDAPFTMPIKHNGRWIMTFSWYFFDPDRNEYVYEVDRAVSYLRTILKTLELESRPVKIIGFSQGGYVAPFIARELPKAEQVILVGARYRDDVLNEKYKFRCDAIHGGKDGIVEFDRARSCFESISKNGNRGEFVAIEDMGHEISSEATSEINRLLNL